MLIICPNCSTSYMVEPVSLGSAGRTVRCARCQTTWFAGGPEVASADVAVAVDSHAVVESNAADRVEELPDLTIPTPSEPEPAVMEAEESQSGTESPPLVPLAEPAAAPETAAAEPEAEDVESFAARRRHLKMRRPQTRRSSRGTAILLVLLAFNVSLIAARNDVVRYLPQTAPFFAAIGLPVNLRHLKFEHVQISRETENGVVILVVQGTIMSTAGQPVKVPRLRFALRNASERELYTWTELPNRRVLAPGAQLKFYSQLAAPPKGAHDVMVRFFTAADAASEAT